MAPAFATNLKKDISVLVIVLSACFVIAAEKKYDPSLAQHRTYGVWHSSELGGGGFLQQVFWAQSDPNRLYLSSDVGGLWRSDDGGSHWHMLHGCLPARADSYSVRSIAIHPKNADKLMAALDSGVWMSDDAGKSFRQVLKTKFMGNGPTRSEGVVLIFNPVAPDNVYAAGMDDGFFYSNDGGKNWTRSGPRQINPVDLHIDRNNPRRIWMCALPVKKDWNIPHELDGGIYLSENAGKSWKKISDEKIGEIRQLPFDTNTLIGLEREKQVMISSDLGTTWIQFNSGLAPRKNGDARVDGLYTALDTGPDFVVLGSHGGNFYILREGENHWNKVFERNPDKVDEGNWWGSLKKTYPHFGSALGWVKVNPHDSANWAFTDWYAIYFSNDSGKTWKLSIDGVEMTVVHCLTQDLTNPDAIHLGVADVGYFYANNGGGKFTQRNTGISNNTKHIAVCASRPQRLYGTGPREWHWYANQIFRSDDDGKKWIRPAMKGLPKMDWERCNTIVVHPKKPDEVYLAVSGQVKPGAGGVYKSTDGGESWVWFSKGFAETDSFFREQIWVSGPEIAVSPDGALVAASVDTGNVYAHTPGSEQWQRIELGGSLNSVVADTVKPGRFWLAKKEGGLWRSDDGGKNWKRISNRNAWHIALDHFNPGYVVFNGSQGIYFSNNDGITWQKLSDTLPYKHERNVPAFTHGRILVGSGGNGVFWTNISDITSAEEKHGNVMDGKKAILESSPLIYNGDMEHGKSLPEHWGINAGNNKATLTLDRKIKAEGSSSLRLDLKDNSSAFAQQRLNWIPVSEFEITGKIKFSKGIKKAVFPVQVFDKNWRQLSWNEAISITGSSGMDWKHFSRTFKLPPNAHNAMVGLYVEGTGSAWIDAIQFDLK